MMDDSIHLTLIRHGRTLADDEGSYESRYDAPLTETGQAQARARASAWQQAGIGFDRIIASPLPRAHSTALILAEAFAAPLELDLDWIEMDTSAPPAETRATGVAPFPRACFRGPFEAASSGESEVEVHARAAVALQKIVRRGPGRTLVVAHDGILNAALRVVCGSPAPVNTSGVWFPWSDLGCCRLIYHPGQCLWCFVAFGG